MRGCKLGLSPLFSFLNSGYEGFCLIPLIGWRSVNARVEFYGHAVQLISLITKAQFTCTKLLLLRSHTDP